MTSLVLTLITVNVRAQTEKERERDREVVTDYQMTVGGFGVTNRYVCFVLQPSRPRDQQVHFVSPAHQCYIMIAIHQLSTHRI